MDDRPKSTKRVYGVKQVRGPFVSLEPHANMCVTDKEFVRYAKSRVRPTGADLFCGAGGLSLGLEEAGFDMVLGVDNDHEALDTHRHLFGGMTLDLDLGDDDNVERVVSLCRAARIDLIAGGPPCQPFSRAGRSMIKDLVRREKRQAHDTRRDLWQSFLAVVDGVRPKAVLMENVPDMALDRDMQIIRTFVEVLEGWGYSVENRVIDTWRHGVPQMRSRLILVALRDGVAFDWPVEAEHVVSVREAIGDLPPVEGGARPEGGDRGWWPYEGPRTIFQRRARRLVPAEQQDRVFDHITRPVREDDLLAFEQMDDLTKYSDLPDELKRYRDDIFDDKYKRLSWDDLSRTITAHIAKDGYWYIHPKQHRTLTIREAARLQTFADSTRFSGPPSAAFRQIGNAVPPLLGLRVGESIIGSLERRRSAAWTTTEVSDSLADWFRNRPIVSIPWLRAETRWSALQAELLLERAPTDYARSLWPLLAKLSSPGETVQHNGQVREMGKWIHRAKQADRVIAAAEWFAENPEALESREGMVACPEVGPAIADLVERIRPQVDPLTGEVTTDPILATKGVLRVAARFTGKPVNRTNTYTDGRLAVARLVGAGEKGDNAHLALIELANAICTPAKPKCGECPLSLNCVESRRRGSQARLFRRP